MLLIGQPGLGSFLGKSRLVSLAPRIIQDALYGLTKNLLLHFNKRNSKSHLILRAKVKCLKNHTIPM